MTPPESGLNVRATPLHAVVGLLPVRQERAAAADGASIGRAGRHTRQAQEGGDGGRGADDGHFVAPESPPGTLTNPFMNRHRNYNK